MSLIVVIYMNKGFVKLFGDILISSVWQEPWQTKLVWITMLALSDRDGYVGAAIPGLAHAAGVPMKDCEEAIEKFMAPDPHSRNKENDGRRIEEADRGWKILNYGIFRERLSKEETNARKAKWAKDKRHNDASAKYRKEENNEQV